jgi:hypothetical protein
MEKQGRREEAGPPTAQGFLTHRVCQWLYLFKDKSSKKIFFMT